jgi:hypothetical protein
MTRLLLPVTAFATGRAKNVGACNDADQNEVAAAFYVRSLILCPLAKSATQQKARPRSALEKLMTKPPTLNALRTLAPASSLIAAGLSVLLAQCYWSALPAATGLALVALGAICATIERSRHTASWRTMLAISLVVYGTLYFLLLGAILDSTMRAGPGSLALPQYIDFAISAFVMLIAARTGFAAFAKGEHASPR